MCTSDISNKKHNLKEINNYLMTEDDSQREETAYRPTTVNLSIIFS